MQDFALLRREAQDHIHASGDRVGRVKMHHEASRTPRIDFNPRPGH